MITNFALKKRKEKLDPFEFENRVLVYVYYPCLPPHSPEWNGLERKNCPPKQLVRRKARSATGESSVPLH